MKPTFVLGVLFVVSGGSLRTEQEIVYSPEEGTVLRRTFEARAELAIASHDLLVDGEVDREDESLPDAGMKFVERIVVRDEIGPVEDGRPTRLERTFEELSQENVEHDGDQEVESSHVSDLEGTTVRFVWDAEEEDYAVEAADDEEIESALLELLEEDMDLRLILPEGEVEKGDEWEVPVEAYLYWMWPGGHLAFHAEGEEQDATDFYEQVVENLEGTGRARFLEVRTDDERELAVLRVEFEITTYFEREPQEDGPPITQKSVIERQIEGEVLWDLAGGHPVSAELQADVKRIDSSSGTGRTEDGEEIEVEERYTHEGTYEYTATFELVE